MSRNRIADSTDIGDRLREIKNEERRSNTGEASSDKPAYVFVRAFISFEAIAKNVPITVLIENKDGLFKIDNRIARCSDCEYPNNCVCYSGASNVWARLIGG